MVGSHNIRLFYNANEGMRVFDGNQKACKWWNEPQNYNYVDEKD